MTDWPSKLYKKLFGSGNLLRQITTVLAGTATAQLLSLGAMVLLARLYSPSDFGIYAIFQSVVAVGVTMAALRYDVAIVLPRSDLAARTLQRLASRLILLSSVALSTALLIAYPLISRLYDDTVAAGLVSAGFVVYVAAQGTNLQYWLTRRMRYRTIAANRLIQAAAVSGFQIGLAFILDGFAGLLIGLLVGQLVALIWAYHHTPELRGDLPSGAPTVGEMAKRYRKMPLINGPNALLDSVKTSGINVLIAKIAVSGLGQYSLAMQVTRAPVSLLAAATSQVFLQRLSTVQPGGMVPLLRAAFSRIFILSAPVFTLFYFVAPSLLPFAFGERWADAGLIAQALVPWLFMLTFTAPLSSIFVVVERQEWSLIIAALSTIAAVGFLAFTTLDLLAAVSWLSLIMAAILLIWMGVALLVARQFDASH